MDDAPDPAASAANAAAEEKALRLIGLGIRARNAVVGVDRVREAAKGGTLYLAAVASDRLEPLLTRRGGPRAVVLRARLDVAHAERFDNGPENGHRGGDHGDLHFEGGGDEDGRAEEGEIQAGRRAGTVLDDGHKTRNRNGGHTGSH